MLTVQLFIGASEETSKEAAGGLSALGLDVKLFLFQFITFVIVLLILKKFVFTKLVATLEHRRETLEKSLDQAKETQQALKSAEAEAAKLLSSARSQADGLLSDASKQAQELMSEAEKKGSEKAERIVAEAKEQLSHERDALRHELRAELAELVIVATEKVINEKLDSNKDETLIKEAIKV